MTRSLLSGCEANYSRAVATASYGVVLLMAAIAYYLLERAIIRAQGQDSILKKGLGMIGRPS